MTMYQSLNVKFRSNLKGMENTRVYIGKNKKKIHRKLKEDRWYRPVLDYAKGSSLINCVYLVIGTSIVFSHYGTAMITGCVGFMYPGYKMLNLLQNTYDVETGRKWIIYWFLYSALSFVEIFLFFLDWIPMYWILKCCFLYWCYAPLPRNGTDIVYSYMIQPFFQRNQEVIDNTINHMAQTAHSMITEYDPPVPTNASTDAMDEN